MSRGCFTWKPHSREGGGCSAWQRWAARRAGCNVPYGARGERQGAARTKIWGNDQAGSPCHCLPEGTQKGSAITGAFTVPTSPGGFRRAWQRSGTGSHILASEDSGGTGRASQGSHTYRHPPAHAEGPEQDAPARGTQPSPALHPTPGTEVEQASRTCRGTRSTSPDSAQHRQRGYKGGSRIQLQQEPKPSSSPAPLPPEQHSQPVPGTRGPAPHQSPLGRNAGPAWEGQAIAALIMGLSCCLDLS